MVEIFTVASFDSLGGVRTLFESIRHHHPDFLTTLVVPDRTSEQWSTMDIEREPFDQVVFAADETDGNLLEPGLLFGLTEQELTVLCKPIYAQSRLQAAHYDILLYLSPSSVVFASLNEILEDIGRSSICLVPQVLTPESMPDEDLALQIDVLRHGVFSGGFMGLTPSAQALKFVEWWRCRLLEIQYGPHAENLFDTQWLDLVPSLFEDVRIEHRPNYNVSPLNYLERSLSGNFDEGFSVGSELLIHADFRHPFSTKISTTEQAQNRSSLAFQVLLNWYRSRTQENTTGCLPHWAMNCFTDGTSIREEYRSLYRTRKDLQQAFPDPFCTDDPSYLRWLQTEFQSVDGNIVG